MAASPSELKDRELERLQLLITLFDSVEEVVSQVQDENEYKRMREFINARFQSADLPYTSPFIKEVQGLV